MSEQQQLQTHIEHNRNLSGAWQMLADAIKSGDDTAIKNARLNIELINAANSALYHARQMIVYQEQLARWQQQHIKETAETNQHWIAMLTRARLLEHTHPRIKTILEHISKLDFSDQELKNRAYLTLRNEVNAATGIVKA